MNTTACLRVPPNFDLATPACLPACGCSHRREMRLLPACRLRLSRRLATPGDNQGLLLPE
eukprot:scaffold43099_cov75-Cyclotella_meneghiniana.AAC.5